MLLNKTRLLQSLALAGLITFASCSGSDSLPTPATPQGKTYKFTITITGVNTADDHDYVSVVFAGGSYTQNKSIWKINGIVQNNQEGVGLDADDFAGTQTYVVESTEPLRGAQVGIQCLNFDGPYTISFRAESDGQVKHEDQNITVTETSDYTHDFTF